MTLQDTAGNVASYRQWTNISQVSAGSPEGSSSVGAFITNTFPGTTLAITRNASNNLDFNFTLGAGYLTYDYYLEVVVTNPKVF
jgi:hypothetical protein